MPSSVPRKSSSLWLALGPTEVGIGHHLIGQMLMLMLIIDDLLKDPRRQTMKLIMIVEEEIIAVLRPLCVAIIK